MMIRILFFALMSFTLAQGASAADCSDMEAWDSSMNMCMPLSMAGMPMRMLTLRGNAFATGITESGPRGRTDFAAPNMVMADAGTSVGSAHYLNLDLMGTLERWTFPYGGYPELLQIGESNSQGKPFVDAQHPHSSPIMGLTLSDTIRLNDESKNNLKLFFAPRGESTDGPIAFMHRITGMANPDAPLGHHIGQDVGHISSTVLGGALHVGSTQIELSTYFGKEPEPDSVDLPLRIPNSFSARLTEEFSPHYTAMVSIAQVNDSEINAARIYRYSASLYTDHDFGAGWRLNHTFIFGLITNYDSASTLASFTDEFLLKKDAHAIWGRVEVVERTPAELEITSLPHQNDGQWIEAVTLGYTHRLAKWTDTELGLGSSVTMDILPSNFASTYGSGTPLTGKIFLQFGGMKMWDI